MFGNHGLCGLLEEGAHGKSPKCLDGNLGDFGEFCKGLSPYVATGVRDRSLYAILKDWVGESYFRAKRIWGKIGYSVSEKLSFSEY